ncbi:hypothetical protein BHE74_00001146, partial [Ensete ventricosum]
SYFPWSAPFITACPSSVRLSFAQVEAPSAMAVTGNNMEEDLVTTLVSGGIVAILYLFVIPVSPERLAAFGCRADSLVLMLWAPFLNFRKFPRDPTMEYPWSTPKDDVPLYKSR